MDTLTDVIQKGGPFFIANIFFLAIVIAIIVERTIYFVGRGTINTKAFFEQIKRLLAANNIDRAKKLCDASPAPVARVAKAGLSRTHRGEAAVARHGRAMRHNRRVPLRRADDVLVAVVDDLHGPAAGAREERGERNEKEQEPEEPKQPNGHGRRLRCLLARQEHHEPGGRQCPGSRQEAGHNGDDDRAPEEERARGERPVARPDLQVYREKGAPDPDGGLVTEGEGDDEREGEGVPLPGRPEPRGDGDLVDDRDELAEERDPDRSGKGGPHVADGRGAHGRVSHLRGKGHAEQVWSREGEGAEGAPLPREGEGWGEGV